MGLKCDVCENGIGRNVKKLLCGLCEGSFHYKCLNLNEAQYETIVSAGDIGAPWMCKTCNKLHKDFVSRISKIETTVTEFRVTLRDHGKRLEAIEEGLKSARTVTPTPNAEVVTNVYREVRKTFDERAQRRCNLVVRDLPESQAEGSDVRKEEDTFGAIRALGVSDDDVQSTFRAGKKRNDEKPRPLIVRLKSVELRDRLLRHGRDGVRLGPDLCKKDRDFETEFFKDLEEKKKEQPGLVFRVKGPPGARWLETSTRARAS